MNELHLVQLGMGVDLRGADTTKAAVRAVRNAIGHNLLPGIRRVDFAEGFSAGAAQDITCQPPRSHQRLLEAIACGKSAGARPRPGATRRKSEKQVDNFAVIALSRSACHRAHPRAAWRRACNWSTDPAA